MRGHQLVHSRGCAIAAMCETRSGELLSLSSKRPRQTLVRDSWVKRADGMRVAAGELRLVAIRERAQVVVRN